MYSHLINDFLKIRRRKLLKDAAREKYFFPSNINISYQQLDILG